MQYLTRLGLTSCLITLLSSIVSLPTISQQTSGTFFYCGDHLGEPAIMAQTPDTTVPVIRFVSGYFENSGWSDEERCQAVSTRFQNYYVSGKLNYLTTGKLNRENIICVAEYDQGPCISENSGLLLTLKRGVNPRQALIKLLAVRDGAGPAMNETGPRLYVSVKGILNNPVAQKPQPSQVPGKLW